MDRKEDKICVNDSIHTADMPHARAQDIQRNGLIMMTFIEYKFKFIWTIVH